MSKKILSQLFKIQNSLGSLELQVMELMWKKEKGSVRSVLEMLKLKKPFAYTTIMTVMVNLHKKGYLSRTKVKKSFYYSPVENKNTLISDGLSSSLKELSRYGKIRLAIVFLSVLIAFPHLSLFSTKTFSTYKTPIWYGWSLAIFSGLFAFSIFDLLESLKILGTFDFLKLASDPSVLLTRFKLLSFALLESLPIENILITVVSLLFVIILAKKMATLLDLRLLRII